ncbi:MFS transporter [Alphaproteobacteria bacterium endosymbiont of Tiliacea citrago]|uniref:MFS transporter n=1 Tax=Alphaproteobacteria bacterium endosymbiont of Tiliacea citrago TaxID=3077944 RepID=UPI00313BF81A
MNLLGVLIAFVEWYDTAVTIAFSHAIYYSFFPNFQKELAFKTELLLITCSCLGKPIGAYLIGKFSDNYDRLQAAKVSFFLMIFCSFFIVFLPSFQSIGYFSLFLFFIIKFIQGIAVGGNYATSVYSIEQSNQKFFISSLTSFSIFCGFFLANTFHSFFYRFDQSFYNLFAWRVAYFFTIIFSLPIFWLINKESSLKKVINYEENKIYNNETFEFFRTCFLVLLDVIPFQYFHVFLPNYKRLILQYNETLIQKGIFTTLLTINIITPFVGKIADKFGPMFFLKSSALMMIFSFFIFHYIFENFAKFFIADIYFGVMMAFCYGTLYCYLPMNFCKNSRARLSGFALNFTTSIVLILMPVFSNSIEKYILHILLFIGTFSFALLSIKDKSNVF